MSKTLKTKARINWKNTARAQNVAIGQLRDKIASLEKLVGDQQRAAQSYQQHEIDLINKIGKLRQEATQEHRVLRIIEFAGERDAVEAQVRQSIHGTITCRQGRVNITAVTLHDYPESLMMARKAAGFLNTDNPAIRADSAVPVDSHNAVRTVRDFKHVNNAND